MRWFEQFSFYMGHGQETLSGKEPDTHAVPERWFLSDVLSWSPNHDQNN